MTRNYVHRVGSASPEVDALLASIGHERAEQIDAVRAIIRGADASVVEGVKWNAPSFRTGEWFATIHLRAKGCVQIIFHLGAKKRDVPGFAIDDPHGLLSWLGDDRATVKLADADDIASKRAALESIVRQWIRFVRL